MSFDPNPDLYEYEPPPNVCLGCFEVGKSPASLFVNFSGIKIGAGWLPLDPEPPNGIYEITASAPCRWNRTIGPWNFDYNMIGGGSNVQIWDGGLLFPFTQQLLNPCELWFANFQQNPIFTYFGGWCVVTPPLPGGTFSEVELLDLVGIDTIRQTWANPRPAPADISFHTISRAADATNIKIKFDHA